MTVNRKRLVALLSTLVVCILVLSGCGTYYGSTEDAFIEKTSGYGYYITDAMEETAEKYPDGDYTSAVVAAKFDPDTEECVVQIDYYAFATVDRAEAVAELLDNVHNQKYKEYAKSSADIELDDYVNHTLETQNVYMSVRRVGKSVINVWSRQDQKHEAVQLINALGY